MEAEGNRELENKEQLSPEGISEPEFSYFGVQAYWGATKHFGGFMATEELAELCRIAEDKYVLNVGCGVGITACYLAEKYGCRVVGIDISERMIDWSNKRAKREGLEDRVEFRVADAQNLPFEDSLFDAIFCESVTAFVQDKQRAVSEYVRVTKPREYVGLNECTWIKTPPPTELVEYIDRTMGGPEFLTADGWKSVLEGSGLTDIVVRTYRVSALSQWINEMRGLGFRDVLDLLRAWYSFFSLFIRSSTFRKYTKEMVPSPKNIRNLFGYLGYGLYVGRKQAV